MTYNGLELFCHCPGCQMSQVFTFELEKLGDQDLAQLRENMFNPVPGGLVDQDRSRAEVGREEIEVELERRRALPPIVKSYEGVATFGDMAGL